MADKGIKKQATVKKTVKAKRSAKSAAKPPKARKKREKVAVGEELVLEPVMVADSVEESADTVACPPLEEKYFSTADDEQGGSQAAAVHAETVDENRLQIKLSGSLRKKLKQQAQDEGLSLEDFISELLAESVVLRAWEIVERKNQMRSSPSNHNSQNSGHRSGNHQQNRGGNRKGHRGMSHGRYQSIMDDKATFLEYVRNQERSRR